jgi:hypothetical protein
MRNPNVSVRRRGVIEKCTYCIERVSAACITAGEQDRPVGDGEIRTACQQACQCLNRSFLAEVDHSVAK